MRTALPRHVVELLPTWGLTLDEWATEGLAESRNCTLVARRGARKFLVKAAWGPLERGVDQEAALLPQLGALLGSVRGAPRVPPVFAAAPGVVALEWLPGTTLWAQARDGAVGDVLERVGRALAVVHVRSHQQKWLFGRREPTTLAQGLAWTSPAFYAALSPTSLTVWKRAHEDAAMMEALVRLVATEDREPLGLVHGDCRQANVVAGRRPALVDWEEASWGEGARDVGMLLADDVAAHLDRHLVVPELRRRARGLMHGYLEQAVREGASPGPHFPERVVAWMAEALLRRAWTVAHRDARFGADELRLVESAGDALANPRAWSRWLWGGRR